MSKVPIRYIATPAIAIFFSKGLVDQTADSIPSFSSWYGCVDILAKPVFCAIHCHALMRCDYARLGLSSGKFSSAMEDVSLTNGAHVGANSGHNGVLHDKSNVNGATGVNGVHHTGVNNGVGTGTGTGLGGDTTGTGVGTGVGHHGVVGHNATTGPTV